MRRYSVAYFRVAVVPGVRVNAPDAHGTSDHLTNLVRHAAGRCAAEEYQKAVIRDRSSGFIMRTLRRAPSGSILITQPRED